MLCDNAVKGLYVFEGTTHNERIRDAVSIIGKHSHFRFRMGHRAKFCKMFSGQANCYRTNRKNITVAGFLTQCHYLLDYPSCVSNG